MDSTEPRPRIAADKLVIGLALIAAGIAGILGMMDVLEFRDIGRLWPIALIVFGLAGEIEAIRNRTGSGSFILIAIGTWFLVGQFHLFGLSFGRALPVAIAIVGAGIALHAMTDKPQPKQGERS